MMHLSAFRRGTVTRSVRYQGLLIQIKAFKERAHTLACLSGGNAREKQAVTTEPR